MIIIIGLGNPGKKYKNTRHNIGFQIIDEFRKKNDLPEFKLSKKFNALISKEFFVKKEIILVKPQTFMNNSGKAVKAIFNFQFSNKSLIIIHDDIDLPLGKIKIVKKRGSAGHKGVQSIIDELGTKNFVRLRVGIKATNSEQQTKNNLNVEKFVLQKFEKSEEKIVKEVIRQSCQAIKLAIKGGIEKAMQKFNI